MPSNDLKQVCRRSPVMWYPRGKYACFIVEVPEAHAECLADLPARYLVAKAKGFPEPEQRIGWDGQPTTKWVKEVDAFEWVPGADLLKDAAELRKPLTNLLQNLVLIIGFR